MSGICLLIVPVPVHCFYITFISRVLVVVKCGGPKSFPTHPFNALIFPILRGCVQSFVISCPLTPFHLETVLKVLNGLTFASRCINILTFLSVDLY